MKYAVALILSLFSMLVSAEELYRPGHMNSYDVLKDGKVIGLIEIKAHNQITYHYGTDGVVLYGDYKIEDATGSKGDTEKDFTARVADTDNTTIWVDTAIIKFEVSEADYNAVMTPAGSKVQMKIYVDGSASPIIKNVIIKPAS
ncbi:MAG: hypothetical protein ACXVAX_10075 [Pseudobdellovibrio sp.]